MSMRHADVAFPPPLDVAGSLELFRRSGDDLIDRWDGTRLIRALPLASGHVAFVATAAGSLQQPSMRVQASDDRHLDAVQASLANAFALAPPEYPELLRRDPVLARLDQQYPGIRQIRQLDLFTALVRCISAQQVNLRWAVTTRRRLAETFGTRHEVNGHVVYTLDPARIAALAPEDIRALQFTMSKSHALVAAARAVADGRAVLEELAEVSDEEVIQRLIAIRGIGRWSAEWVLARTLGRPVVVAGDLGVRKAVGIAYLGTAMPSEAEVRRATAHWGASAGVAQALLLHALAEGAISPTRPRVRT